MPLADFFRGRRVTPERRARTPLVCDQVGIIWVAGHRIAERVKATEQTAHVLYVESLCTEGDLGAGGVTICLKGVISGSIRSIHMYSKSEVNSEKVP